MKGASYEKLDSAKTPILPSTQEIPRRLAALFQESETKDQIFIFYYVPPCKRDFADVIEDVEMGRFSWVVWVSPM